MNPILSMSTTRSASSAASSDARGSCVVANENALRNTLACCRAVKSWRRLDGPGARSFTRPRVADADYLALGHDLPQASVRIAWGAAHATATAPLRPRR